MLERQKRASDLGKTFTSQPPDTSAIPIPAQPSRPHHGGSAPTTNSLSTVALLDISKPADNVSSVCPLPVLHPWKWQQKMTWGVRKPFAACDAIPQANIAWFSSVGKDSDTVEIDRTKCPEGGLAIGFKELEDASLPRLQSVMDAEMRQNELRERYAQDPSYSFATIRKPIGAATQWIAMGVTTPYVLVLCGPAEHPRGKQLHIRSQVRPSRATHHAAKRRQGDEGHKGIQNVLHIMFDSTSIHAFRRSAPRTMRWLEKMNNDAVGSSRVYTQKHYHSVSCCSPGNQVPMYAGCINGEGDHFVASEPHRDSKSWLWNIADTLGFTTFWSLDNCPDKSARDFHATPSVDVRVVAPLCLAGVLLSHKDLECLGGRTVDQHVYEGLRRFWQQHSVERKFAAVQFITPHEESEKQLLELDITTSAFLEEMDAQGEWNRTALVLWSDHGINFGKYATTHDGEFEKLLPFAHVMLPRWLVDDASPSWGRALRINQDRLVAPYDLYELGRSLLYYPNAPPPYAASRDTHDPPLPRPSESHIMASFQKPVTPINPVEAVVPIDRDCASANIPVEFCTCVPWRVLADDAKDATWRGRGSTLLDVVLQQHRTAIWNVSTAAGYRQGLCLPLMDVELIGMELQEWLTAYKPKEQPVAKRVWMMPNRDMVRLRYRNKRTHADFEAVVSVDKLRPTDLFDVAKIDRLDAMTLKCGLVDKVAEQLCECRS
jgi:hypothetical protein